MRALPRTTHRLRVAGAALALVCAVALAGCGGGGDSGDAKELLDRAFRQPIGQAKVELELEIEVEGIEELRDPIKFKLSGPYRDGGEGRIPAFDWEATLAGGGQSIVAGFISTHENVFVTFQDTAYEVGADTVEAFNRQLAEASRSNPGEGLGRFGIDPTGWLSEARLDGEEDVAGVATDHISARLDVRAMLLDLNKVIDGARGQVPGTPPAKLTDAQIAQVEEVVEDPRFDVYVGRDDGRVRRLSTDLVLKVPEDDRERVGGLRGGTISFTIELSEVGRPQTIRAPESARPIAELTEQLGGLGALRGGIGPGNGTPPPTGGAPDDAPREGGAESEGTEFERYSRCLEQADPSRIDEIERCSEVLR